MEEEKIVLDRKSFEALAVDTRVRILKALKQRRKTLSELSEELGLAVSGVKEHLETLQSAELITKMDDGHKWKYYELTRKGSEIIGPKELRVWILLSLSTLALIFSGLMLLTPPMATGGLESAAPTSGATEKFTIMAATPPANYSGDAAPWVAASEAPAPEPGMQNPEPNAFALNQEPSPVPLAVAVISAIAMLACLAVLAKNRLARP